MFRQCVLLIVVLVMSSLSTGSDENPIVIGLDADMTAVAKEGGLAIQRGALIAIEEINQSGGVLGRHLALEVRDHRGNPSRGVLNIENFAKDPNVVAVIGGVHTPVALHELPVIHENKIIYLGPWAAGTPVVDNGYSPNYVFRVSIRDNQAGNVLMRSAKVSGYGKVALLLERTGWGLSNESSMTAAAETLGMSVVATQWFNWRQKDVSAEVDAIIASGAEAIMLVANAPEGLIIARYMAEKPENQRVPIISHWGISGGDFVNALGLDLLARLDIRVIQTYSFLSPYDEEKNKFVLDHYREAFDSSASALSLPAAVGVAHAYDLVHLLALAIKKAGSLQRPLVRNALEELPRYNGLVKNYVPPFTKQNHDALLAPDYQMMEYDELGHLVPIKVKTDNEG